ncbi:hypothetical protein SAMN05216353_13937 [Halobacillus alkaliphilus]|uniref:Uncharacterized protein n=1 Tax=Halobacillus alkaliphilus TaxID=396056 RepID=A0A1I2RI51_9BACI|nr:hypothetical protein [Halobacillus alkaliphilus]SFG39159.1 hypothetical protein SAMN05216353_13937 [Halobacillus alkaliphilus]
MCGITKLAEGMVWLLIAGFLGVYFFISESVIGFIGFMLLPAYSIIGMVLTGLGISRESLVKYKLLNITAFLIFAACFIFPLSIYMQISMN